MNKNRLMMGLFVFIGLGIFGLWTYDNLSGKGEVYTVNNTLKWRHLITEDDIRLMEVSKHEITENMITKKEDIVGKYIKIGHTIYPGWPLIQESIETIDESQQKASLLLKDNQKVVSVKADLLMSGGNSFGVNQYVDIIYTSIGRGVQTSKVLLKNVRIVGVKNRKGEDVDKEGVPHLIMLAIHDDFVTLMIDAMENGSISLVGVIDNEEEECVIGEMVSFDGE